MKENSIKNEQSSIEEDIKILEDKLKLNATTKFDWFGEKEFQALGNLINRNKELEENSIPVSLVEEMIEEYKNEIDKLYNQKVWNEPMDTIYNNRYVNYINILQELLEKRK